MHRSKTRSGFPSTITAASLPKAQLAVPKAGTSLPQVIPPALEAHVCPLLHLGYCFEWKYRARLEIKLEPQREAEVVCYSVHWGATSVHTELVDCYALDGAEWFGMGEVHNLSWPLSNLQLSMRPFETGRADPLGSVLEPYWLSSRGVSIVAQTGQSLMFSFNATGSNRLCLAAKEELNYTLCTGPDVLAIHRASAGRLRRPPAGNLTADEETFVKHPVLVPRPGEDGNLTQVGPWGTGSLRDSLQQWFTNGGS